jgi:hypothetical protein
MMVVTGVPAALALSTARCSAVPLFGLTAIRLVSLGMNLSDECPTPYAQEEKERKQSLSDDFA